MTREGPTRRRFVLLAGSATLTGMAGCSESSAEDPAPSTDGADSASSTAATSSTEPTAESPAATAAETDDATVVAMLTDNQGSYFDPKGLLVEPGTTIRFVNESGSHRTAAYHPENDDKPLRIPTAADPWDSPLYTDEGERFEISLDTAGVYDFYCPPHESLGMVGRIVVDEPRDGPATSPPEELPPGAQESLPSIDDVVENGRIPGP